MVVRLIVSTFAIIGALLIYRIVAAISLVVTGVVIFLSVILVVAGRGSSVDVGLKKVRQPLIDKLYGFTVSVREALARRLRAYSQKR